MVPIRKHAVLSAVALFVSLPVSCAFVVPTWSVLGSRSRPHTFGSTSLSMSTEGGKKKNIVVVSPPGGIGEVTAVEAAKLGGSVRWFVVSPPSSPLKIALPEDILASISAAGGAVDLAGADAPSLLLSMEDPQSAIPAVSKWCGEADGLICTFDGVKKEKEKESGSEDDKEEENTTQMMIDAVKVAAREAANVVVSGGLRLAVLSAVEDLAESDEEGRSDGVGGLLKSIVGKKGRAPVPESLGKALSGGSSAKVTTLRHGELFGIPESSPEFSYFVGGPRRSPVLREELTMRTVRMDPTISVSGISMMGRSTRSSRLSVGEGAARMALRLVPFIDGADLCLTSQRGMDTLSDEEWDSEFNRVEEMLSSGTGAQLFRADFSSVPNTERLADWIATKWAPAVLRTYVIAGIRIGARPVYASRTAEGTVEIVWQKLVDFTSVTVGRMIIEVSNEGLVASRGPGDASAGFGTISLKPLAGEDILVRRLADAASQAIEKGLAKKPVAAKKAKEPKKEAPPAPVVTTVMSSGDLETPAEAATPERSLDTGPRTAGARRSSERRRGKRRKTTNDGESEPGSTDSFQ